MSDVEIGLFLDKCNADVDQLKPTEIVVSFSAVSKWNEAPIPAPPPRSDSRGKKDRESKMGDAQPADSNKPGACHTITTHGPKATADFAWGFNRFSAIVRRRRAGEGDAAAGAAGRGAALVEEPRDGAAAAAPAHHGDARRRPQPPRGTPRAQAAHAGAARLPRAHGVLGQLRVRRRGASDGRTRQGQLCCMEISKLRMFLGFMTTKRPQPEDKFYCGYSACRVVVLVAGQLQICGQCESDRDFTWQMHQLVPRRSFVQ